MAPMVYVGLTHEYGHWNYNGHIHVHEATCPSSACCALSFGSHQKGQSLKTSESFPKTAGSLLF